MKADNNSGKPALIMLHGALGSSKQFERIAMHLSGGFVVYTPAFSGHGGAAYNPDGFSVEIFRDEIAGFMDTNSIEQAYIFGYSMGGYVGMLLAKSYPHRVSGLMTLGTRWVWSPEIAQREIGMLQPDIMERKVPEYTQLLESIHAPNDWKALVKRTSELMQELGENPLRDEDYNSIYAPVRISIGDKDKMAGVVESYETFRKIPGASFWVLPETPHPFEHTDMGVLVREISSFFKKQNTGT